MTDVVVGWGSSSMAGIGPALESALRDRGVGFMNQGQGGETSHHTCARIGSIPLRVTVEGGRLPAAGTIRLSPSPLDMVPGFLKTFAGTVSGMSGTVHGEEVGVWFTRRSPGAPLEVDGEPFIPLTGTALRSNDALLWIGKNDLNRGAAASAVVERTRRTVAWLSEAGARVAVIGHFTNNHDEPEVSRRVHAVNGELADILGARFIDVQDFLTGDGIWDAAGMSPTSIDRTDLAAGCKPSSMSTDPGHLNQVGYHAVADHVVGNLERMGWFE